MTEIPSSPINFGTDGWRAIIADTFTFENVRYCAQGFAGYLKESGLAGRGIVIGYDTRFASENFAAAAAEVLAGNGIRVFLSPETVPTPVTSYNVLERKAGGGIVITASHNAGNYNGFKIKDENGSSASDAISAKVVRHVEEAWAAQRYESMALKEARAKGLVQTADLAGAYREQINRLVDLERLRKAGLTIAIDPMYGAGAGWLASLLSGGNNTIIELHGERNPLFPGLHPEPIMPHLDELAAVIRERGAHVGLATDGDADRMGIVDENGVFLNQLQVYALLALYLLEVRGERGALVKTLTTTSMAYRLGELYNVPVIETAVGFKYVAPEMTANDAIMGGEESGGYGFKGHVLERDGILANLYFLDLIVQTGKKPSELIRYLYDKVGPHYYKRVDIKFPAEQRERIEKRVSEGAPGVIDGKKVVKVDSYDGYRFTLEDNTWLLIRFSGTETLLRVYTETDSPERADRILQEGKTIAGVA